MGSHDSPCNTGLSLGLTFDHSYAGSVDHRRLNSSRSNHEEGFVASPSLRFDHVIPPLSLGGPAADLATDGCNPHPPPPLTAAMVVAGDDTYRHHQIGSNISPGSTSSYSNNNKRYYNSPGIEDKEFGGEEEVNCNNKVVSSRMISDEEEEAEASPRKKLRLTKQQSAVLEDSFREHSTLNPTQKQTLATQLNLRPRQVEVWFQNRRARTKLKQTETDCELLKKCCETLTEENKRLHREIQELKSLNLVSDSPPPQHYMQMPAATLSLCPSCADGNSAPNSNYNTSLNSIHGSPGNGSRKSAFPSLNNGSDTKQQPPGLSFNITTRSSAAC